MKERGSALLTVVVSVLVLLLTSGIFFSLVISNFKVESSEEKGLKVVYLAEAGIQYGIAEVLNGKDIKGKKSDPVTINNPFGPEYGGSYTVEWEDKGNSFIVKSSATYNGVNRRLAAEYKYIK